MSDDNTPPEVAALAGLLEEIRRDARVLLAKADHAMAVRCVFDDSYRDAVNIGIDCGMTAVLRAFAERGDEINALCAAIDRTGAGDE